jgi:hypothetical protein
MFIEAKPVSEAIKAQAASLTREQGVNIIWNETHPDFRGHVGADKSIMLPANMAGRLGTSTALLAKLNESDYQQLLVAALERMERTKNQNFARVVLARYGLNPGDGTINQWCGTLDGFSDLVITANYKERQQLLNDINTEVLSRIMKWKSEDSLTVAP